MKVISYRCDACGTCLKCNVGPLSFVSARIMSWTNSEPDLGVVHDFCSIKCVTKWLEQHKYIRKEACSDVLTRDN